MRKPKILIVDDDPRILSSLSSYLRESGFEIVTAADCEQAGKLNNANIDLALLDLRLPDGNGVELLEAFKQKYPHQVAVMISAEATVSDAVRAIRLGAVDFLEKPVSPEKVEITIRNALELSSLKRSLQKKRDDLKEKFLLVGSSDKISQVRQMIDDVSATDSSVLLLGESGTGKEVAANLIHLQSNRGDEPFVAVNTAAIPAELLESEMFGHEKGAFTGATSRRIGRFEQAAGGTLFLDEIAEMPAVLQAKLLRVLEERQIQRVGSSESIDVDIRLICATNRNLTEEIKAGNFRQDLFFRINVFAIEMPPLRQVREDIEEIADFHLEKLCRRMGRVKPALSRETAKKLKSYHFPGNARELRNLLEHLLISSRGGDLDSAKLDNLLAGDLVSGSSGLTLKEAVGKFELDYIQKTIEECNGNISKAAERLGLDRSYLYRKIRSLGIDDD